MFGRLADGRMLPDGLKNSPPESYARSREAGHWGMRNLAGCVLKNSKFSKSMQNHNWAYTASAFLQVFQPERVLAARMQTAIPAGRKRTLYHSVNTPVITKNMGVPQAKK